MNGRAKWCVIFCVGAYLSAAGCAAIRPTETVKTGDKVRVDFTCRLASGEIAATTDPVLTQDRNAVKANVFVPRASKDPLLITAGIEKGDTENPAEWGLEEEILARIAHAVVGMRPGGSETILLDAQPVMGTGEDRVVQMARVRFRPKQLRMTVEEYRQNAKKNPEVGQAYFVDPSIPCNVTSVSENEVAVQCFSQTGKRVETPFGSATINETEKAYEIHIDAEVGRLVRTGGYVGRIVKVDDRSFVIDYNHPFGYEKLKCDVKVDGVEEAEGSKLKAEGK
jgi:FKBP-type peptidyl-prolyl cis-trans isomerase 2